MEKNMGTIYKIENLVNGKVYIGQTMHCVNKRMRVHRAKLKRGCHHSGHLQNAFNKYGADRFKVSILENCNIEEIDSREKFWIKYYKDQGLSYNIEDGGNYIKEIPMETRKKMSESHKGLFKGEKNPMYGKTPSRETRDKLAIATKKSWQDTKIRAKRLSNLKYGKENSNSRSVICVTDGNVFDNMTQAGKYYNISMKAIQQTVSGRNPYCYSSDRTYKLEFCYYKEGRTYTPKAHINKHCVPVVCITTNEVFSSVKEPSIKYNIPTTNISKVCQGKRKHAGKLKDGTKLSWKYA